MNTISAPVSQSSYRSDIDGLRAVAVISVVAFHAFPSWLKGGFVGVDVFFVISGFLITSHVFESLDKEQFSITNFLSRRIRRIFPALILVMVCSSAFGWFALLADEYAQLGKHVASSAIFMINFILVNESGYFDSAAETKPLLHLWSLAVEEQFYIVWPLVLWLAWRRKFNLLTITILVASVSFYLNLRYVKPYPVETFFWPVGRFWELLSGSVLAWLLLYKSEMLSRIKLSIDKIVVRTIYSVDVEADGSTTSHIMSFFGVFLLVYGITRINGSLSFPSTWALIPVLGTVLIIASGSKAYLNRIILMNPIAVWFGLISYPLYLWHWPVLSFVQILEGNALHRDARIAAVVVSVFLAWITYRFIECRVRNGKNNRLKTLLLIILLSIIGFLGLQISKNGLSDREWIVAKSQIVQDLTQDYFRSATTPEICEQLTLNDGLTNCAATRNQPKTVLLGDSHAPPLFYGLSELYEELDRGVGVLGGGGCPPLYGVVSDWPRKPNNNRCIERMTDTIDLIIRTDFIEEVMLVSRGALYFSGSGFGNYSDPYRDWDLFLYGEASTDRSNSEVFNLGLRKTIDLLLKANKKVTFIFSAPELGFDNKSCISARYYFPAETVRYPCSIEAKKFHDRVRAFYLSTKQLLSNYPSVPVLDLSEALCDQNECLAGDGLRLFYFDDDHLSGYGAKFVVESLKNEFTALYEHKVNQL